MTEEIEISAARQELLTFINMSDSGDYRADCARGRRLADELIDRMRERQLPTMLGNICRGIVDAGRWKAVHVGFFHRLAEYCCFEPIRTEEACAAR